MLHGVYGKPELVNSYRASWVLWFWTVDDVLVTFFISCRPLIVANVWNGHSRSLKVIRCCASRRSIYDFLLTLNSNLTSVFNRFWDITPSLHIHTPPLFQVELEKDGWEYLDMLWCQAAQNIQLSKRKLKSILTCTVWSLCMSVPDRQTDGRTNIMAIARHLVLTNASRTKNLVIHNNVSLSCMLTSAMQLLHWQCRSTQPCIPSGSLNRVPASAGVRRESHRCRVAGNTVWSIPHGMWFPVALRWLPQTLHCLLFNPLPSARQHPSYGDCLEVKRKYYQNSSVLDCVTMFTVSSTLIWAVLTLSLIHIWRCRRIERCRSRWSPYH